LLETKSRPHFKRGADGEVAVIGGMTEATAAQATAVRSAVPKLSTRPNEKPRGD
jgi:NAD(P)H-hydrate repair Nnr-like enzyme with NAD(P)H-hydrate dehydratase domain